MIVCVCRSLNTKKVEAAIEDGARTPACVMAHHGKRFNCGKCRPEISQMIAEKPANSCREEAIATAAE